MNRNGPIRSNARPNWLCVAYAFPPINRSGTFRTLGFVKHLDRLGWDATVLTVPPGDEPVDNALLTQVPSSTRVIRAPWTDLIKRIKARCPFGSSRRDPTNRPENVVHDDGTMPDGAGGPNSRDSWREWISRLLMTPDSRVGWIGPAFERGLAAIRGRRPDVIYSTSPYMSAHLIALRLSRRTGIPWVADFRDPWGDNPFRDLGCESLRRWDAWLERLVIKNATHVVCNTATMRECLCQRFPFVGDKSSVILNGFDGELFTEIEPIRVGSSEDFTLTHCGQFYGSRNPLVWFEACRRVLAQSPKLASTMHVVLLGPERYDGCHLKDLAEKAGLGDRVRVLGPKSHRKTLAYMAGSDALMLVGSTGIGGELQVPNKLYEYLAVRRPIIAAVPESNPVVDILSEARAEALVCKPDDPSALADAIMQLGTRRHVDIDDPWEGVSGFDRTYRAKELAEVFQVASRRDRSGRGRILASASAEVQRVSHRPNIIKSHVTTLEGGLLEG